MATPIWSGVTIDATLLSGYGYNETIIVNGESYPRYIGYMVAGIAESGIQTTASAGGLVGSSLSSVAIGSGAKTFTASTGKAWVAGMVLLVSADANNYMIGTVTSYNSVSGALVINALDVVGAGTFTSWVVSLSARRGSTGGQGNPGTPGAAGATGTPGAGSTINAALGGTTVTVAARPLANFLNSLTVADNAGSTRFDVQLVGDAATPGATFYYGTNGAGVKSFYNLTTTVAGIASSILSGNITKFTRFSANGTFTKDARSVIVMVEATGGGMGGWSGNNNINQGAGGEIQSASFAAADLPASLTVTIGAGGAGASVGFPVDGGSTRFGNLIVARGGGYLAFNNAVTAGARLSAGAGGVGGSGGSGSSGSVGFFLGDTYYNVSGADGTVGAGNSGSSAGAITGANAGPALTRKAGGPGGGGARNTGAGPAVGGNGGNGAAPGGAGGSGGNAATTGGGALTQGTGGNGAGGEVCVWETFGA